MKLCRVCGNPSGCGECSCLKTEFNYAERNIEILQRLLEILNLSDVEEIPDAVKRLKAVQS